MEDEKISTKVTMLYVPYSEKDDAKKLGARWDGESRHWYCLSSKKSIFSKWLEERDKIWLIVKQEDVDLARLMGIEWDKSRRSWYGYEGNDMLLQRFKKKKMTPKLNRKYRARVIDYECFECNNIDNVGGEVDIYDADSKFWIRSGALRWH